MTSRERVLAAISHKEADRVPYNLRLVPELLDEVEARIGTTDFAEYFGHDVRYVVLGMPEKPGDVESLQWAPRPTQAAITQIAEDARDLRERGLAVCGMYFMGVYEQAKDWIGDEATMVGPYEDPKGFEALLDRITDWKCSLYGAYAAAGTDIVWMGDDLGTQRSLVMSRSSTESGTGRGTSA